MPRRRRIFVEGGIYHVCNRFARGAELLKDEDEASRFLALLRRVRDRDGLTVFAWCWRFARGDPPGERVALRQPPPSSTPLARATSRSLRRGA